MNEYDCTVCTAGFLGDHHDHDHERIVLRTNLCSISKRSGETYSRQPNSTRRGFHVVRELWNRMWRGSMVKVAECLLLDVQVRVA